MSIWISKLEIYTVKESLLYHATVLIQKLEIHYNAHFNVWIVSITRFWKPTLYLKKMSMSTPTCWSHMQQEYVSLRYTISMGMNVARVSLATTIIKHIINLRRSAYRPKRGLILGTEWNVWDEGSFEWITPLKKKKPDFFDENRSFIISWAVHLVNTVDDSVLRGLIWKKHSRAWWSSSRTCWLESW